jgi:hypothetical protein
LAEFSPKLSGNRIVAASFQNRFGLNSKLTIVDPGVETALWIRGITFGASVLLAPVAFWMFAEPVWEAATVKISFEPLKDMQLNLVPY